VKVTTVEGDTVDLPNLATGFVAFPTLVRRIWATGTAAGLQADDKITLVYTRH